MRIAVGPNSHGMEVYERLVIDPQGNLVKVPFNTRLKEGWVEAEPKDIETAVAAHNDRVEGERKAAEQAHKERKERAIAEAQGGPLLVTSARGTTPLPAAVAARESTFGQDARPVGVTGELVGEGKTTTRSGK